MRSMVLGALAVVGLTAVLPRESAAQDGWWEWALAEGVEAVYGDRYDLGDGRDGWGDRYDRSRRAPYDGNGSRGYELDRALIDIILGRRGGDRARRDRRPDRGPAFCRSGRGHPVHGRAWCREKGWDSYGRYERRPVRWDRRGDWGDIILRRSWLGERRSPVLDLDRRDLADLLGEAVLRRLVAEARLGRGDALSGRLLRPDGRSGVLQLRSGAIPVAELSDVDGDGRVDAVLVPRR